MRLPVPPASKTIPTSVILGTLSDAVVVVAASSVERGVVLVVLVVGQGDRKEATGDDDDNNTTPKSRPVSDILGRANILLSLLQGASTYCARLSIAIGG